jgi:hypothetical protein
MCLEVIPAGVMEQCKLVKQCFKAALCRVLVLVEILVLAVFKKWPDTRIEAKFHEQGRMTRHHITCSLPFPA